MPDIRSQILDRIAVDKSSVWVPSDFASLGSRDAVDKALQRLVRDGTLRRIERGLYDRAALNRLTQQPTTPDYRAVLEAIARRDNLRLLVDGMTAANDLGLTHAVPAKVTVHTDTRRRSLQVGNLKIEFKQTAPSRLYWAGRPAMRVVQALHWLKDTLQSDHQTIMARLAQLLDDPKHGQSIRDDLIDGFSAMPGWMQSVVRLLLDSDISIRSHEGAEIIEAKKVNS